MDRRSDKDIILSNMMSSGEDQLHNQANSNNTASAAAAAVAAAAGFNISDHDYDALLKSSSSTYSLQPSSTLASEARDGTDADNLSAAATAEGQSSSTTILNPITTANASQDVIAASGNESSTPASLTRKVTAPTGGGGGIVGDASTGVSETKLRRFLEHNQRLREQLEMNRVPVSVAGQRYAPRTAHTQNPTPESYLF
ncbi:hypothetical protein EDD11_001252 [Mortierella claussenii]|nr:hypothetical protein EDD11_001252 [Mortierella claussenii]